MHQPEHHTGDELTVKRTMCYTCVQSVCGTSAHPNARYCALAERWQGEVGYNCNGLILGEVLKLHEIGTWASLDE